MSINHLIDDGDVAPLWSNLSIKSLLVDGVPVTGGGGGGGIPRSSGSKSFYIDPSSGDDSNNGESDVTPVKTWTVLMLKMGEFNYDTFHINIPAGVLCDSFYYDSETEWNISDTKSTSLTWDFTSLKCGRVVVGVDFSTLSNPDATPTSSATWTKMNSGLVDMNRYIYGSGVVSSVDCSVYDTIQDIWWAVDNTSSIPADLYTTSSDVGGPLNPHKFVERTEAPFINPSSLVVAISKVPVYIDACHIGPNIEFYAGDFTLRGGFSNGLNMNKSANIQLYGHSDIGTVTMNNCEGLRAFNSELSTIAGSHYSVRFVYSLITTLLGGTQCSIDMANSYTSNIDSADSMSIRASVCDFGGDVSMRYACDAKLTNSKANAATDWDFHSSVISFENTNFSISTLLLDDKSVCSIWHADADFYSLIVRNNSTLNVDSNSGIQDNLGGNTSDYLIECLSNSNIHWNGNYGGQLNKKLLNVVNATFSVGADGGLFVDDASTQTLINLDMYAKLLNEGTIGGSSSVTLLEMDRGSWAMSYDNPIANDGAGSDIKVGDEVASDWGVAVDTSLGSINSTANMCVVLGTPAE